MADIAERPLSIGQHAQDVVGYSEQEKVVPIVQLFLEKAETRIPVASAGMGYHQSETR